MTPAVCKRSGCVGGSVGRHSRQASGNDIGAVRPRRGRCNICRCVWFGTAMRRVVAASTYQCVDGHAGHVHAHGSSRADEPVRAHHARHGGHAVLRRCGAVAGPVARGAAGDGHAAGARRHGVRAGRRVGRPHPVGRVQRAAKRDVVAGLQRQRRGQVERVSGYGVRPDGRVGNLRPCHGHLVVACSPGKGAAVVMQAKTIHQFVRVHWQRRGAHCCCACARLTWLHGHVNRGSWRACTVIIAEQQLRTIGALAQRQRARVPRH
jgi:hypothetical protein